MASRFEAKLKSLVFELPEWCYPPSESLVRKYEEQFGLTLPEDYREFLVHHGGVVGSASCAIQEPAPCGTDTWIDSFYGFVSTDRHIGVTWATETIEGAPEVVAIADNLMGDMFWLKCLGPDKGHVYLHDKEGRSAWTDELFRQSFPNLSPKIEHYLALRKEGKLPKKPKGYDHVYRLARSFTEFVECLEKCEE